MLHISEQPGYTCPDIDNSINIIQDVKKELDFEISRINETDDIDTAAELADNLKDTVKDKMDDIESHLEDLRDTNQELRSWGHEWKSEAEEKERRNKELVAQISELENKVAELESEKIKVIYLDSEGQYV